MSDSSFNNTTNLPLTSTTGLVTANNLSELTGSASTARSNLGLGTASTLASSALLQTANNLSEVTGNTALDNLGVQLFTHTVTGINAKTAAATKIVTSRTGKKFYPKFVFVICTAATSISAGPLFSFGTNASTYNNIYGFGGLDNITAADNFTFIDGLSTPGSPLSAVTSATDIYFIINTGATGTSMTVTVGIGGIYL